jgi:uncharacterized repeat protein (TIGR01451 family)
MPRFKWPHLLGLFILSFALVSFFMQAPPAHALPAGPEVAIGQPGPARLVPPRQEGNTTLEVTILSSPYATLDSNDPTGVDGPVPQVFVVEAAVTNSGDYTAHEVVVSLDYQEDALNGWILLPGEQTDRSVDELAAGQVQHFYWFARYPLPLSGTASHQYNVTAAANNADPVTTSNNFYGNPASGQTVQTRRALSAGNSGLLSSSADIVVGVAFTVTETYDLGSNPVDVVFGPVGNTDFDPSAYRLLATQVTFYDHSQAALGTVSDRVYFPPSDFPDTAETAQVTYTFIALRPANTQVCSYTDVGYSSTRKYDNTFCQTTTSVPIEGRLSLALDKQVSSAITQQGQSLTYTIHYTNTGDLPIQYAWIWDDLPPGALSMDATSIDPPSDPYETDQDRVAWDLDNIAPGDFGSLTFTALVDGQGQDLPDGTQLVNQAHFGINSGSLPQTAALTSSVVTELQAPTIAISKSDGRSLVTSGDVLTYTIQVTNSGSLPASGLVLSDSLPAGVTPIVDRIMPSPDQADPTLVWDTLSPIPADGGTLTVSVPVTVAVQEDTLLANSASLVYRNAAGHQYAPATAGDSTAVQVPVLAFTKTAEDLNGEPLTVGDTVRYTLQVTNTGTYTAYNVAVTDDLPDGVTCQATSGDAAPACADPLVWTLSSLAPGATATLYLDASIDPGSEGQTIVNTGSVTAGNVPIPPENPDPVCPDGSAPVEGVCPSTPEPPSTELAFTKTAEDLNGEPLAVGDMVRYTLQVTNTGTYTAYDVIVSDDLPDGITCQATSGHAAPTCADPLIWTLPSLAPGTTATLYLDASINPGTEGQTIVNTGSVTAGNVPVPPENPAPVCPDGSAPVGDVCPAPPGPATTLDLAKTAEDLNGEPLAVGDTVRYTLQVTNTGTYTAYNVTVTDDLPDEVTCQATSGHAAPACADPLVWTLSSLAPGATATLYLDASIDPGSEGQTIVNTGSVTAGNMPIPPENPDPVCPDGSAPVEGVCPSTPGPAPEEENPKIFLPIILRGG